MIKSSLKSNDPKKIRNYCTFLQTIVFNDFPAEIFLQRSSILKILIDLIIKSSTQVAKESEDVGLIKSLIACVHFYCIKLKKRVDYVKNPSTFCYKDFYTTDFETYSKSIYSSFNLVKEKKKDSSRSNKENMNLSLYSNDNFNSVISSIDSSSANSVVSVNLKNSKINKNSQKQQQQKAKKKPTNETENSQIDENLNQNLQL